MGKKSPNRKPPLKTPAAAVQERKTARLLDEAKRHHQVGELDRAESVYRQLLSQNPGNAEALHYLGVLLSQRGEWESALEILSESIQKAPGVASFHNNLGTLLQQRGESDRALVCFAKALAIQPDYPHARTGLVSVLQDNIPTAYQPERDRILAECFASSCVRHQDLAKAAGVHLRLKHRFQERMGDSAELDPGFLAEIASDDLFLMFLERVFNVDAELEALLTELRRRLIISCFREEAIPAPAGRLALSLAQQCFNNEYVFWVEDQEKDRLARLREDAEGRARAGFSAELEQALLFLAMYVPLCRLSCAAALREIPIHAWSPLFRPLVQRMLLEPWAEEEIKRGIGSIREIHDATSRAVRAQYEENPYPRWFSLGAPQRANFAGELRGKFAGMDVPPFLRGPIQILVAGCGTGAAALNAALAYENASVLAVDLSRGSLAYAVRMTRKLGVKNVRFLQGDILDCGRLGQQFHAINCTGVLHHMERPGTGWDVLTDLLLPRGVMRIGLYSEAARRWIVKAREEIHAAGIGSAPEDIRRFRKGLWAKDKHRELSEFSKFGDFFSASDCRDLLFHVKEHRFTLPQIKRMLEERNLIFLGFDLPRGEIKALYRGRYPADREMRDLDCWAEFEETLPDTFMAMYQFWCQKRVAH